MPAMSTEDQTYNGWKNYPTWCVNLWLSNDEGLYNTVTELVQSSQNDDGTYDRVHLVGEIRELVDEITPDLGATFAADLLGYALDQVDWFEITDAWLEQ